MRIRRLAGSTALVMALAAPAMADVTPEQVWENWLALAQSNGQTVTTESVVRDGDTLVVTGLSLDFAQEGVTGEGSIGEMRFTDQGDGTVAVTMSENYPISLTFPPPPDALEDENEPTTITVDITQPGLSIIASGDSAETTYDFTAPTFTVALTSIEGVDAAAVDAKAEATLSNVTGTYLFVAGEGEAATSDLTSSFAADSMTLVVNGTDPDPSPADDGTAAGPSTVKVNVTMNDITGTTDGTLLATAAMADMASALEAGFTSEGTFNIGTTTYDMEVTDPTGVTKITGTGESSNIAFAMDATRLSYSGGAKNAVTSISAPDIPFPEVKITYGEAAFGFLMPVGVTEEPADFTFLTRLVDFSISEEIWALFDPTNQLPRDPATLIIDTKGTAKLAVNLMDPAAMEAMGDAPPGELNSLDITELRAKVAGAELTGTGALTFDNTDLVTFGGMPAPTGKIDLKLTGGNTLMDKLVQMGLLPEDQAMGFRMMLSMFANATGEDELSSVLEFKDGGFFANGQQLQ
ncbi:hypothetical protein C0V75_03760 [Tabrizicola sp. TH137]|uniref:DUF2125 domain-containing protein n=1 Tax=Tabrizicola sp. TH137 TaxID=2067452 RepID=UPI000C7AA3F8|nr:DUF2125 domain-containing protein [Tabrizicola sp. TH137]PLL14554.1 hypothetical protein C0V75_03760 [Tabrizicola sp. TH137]